MNAAGLSFADLAWLSAVAAGLILCAGVGLGLVLVLAGIPEKLMDVESTLDVR